MASGGMVQQGYLRIRQAGQYLGLSPRTVRSLVGRGLPTYRLPTGAIILKISDLDEFVARFKHDQNRTDNIVNEILKDMR